MRIFFIQLIFPLFYLNALGQVAHSPIRTPYTGLGTYSRDFCDVFSFTNNQAALSSLKTASAAVYAEQRFFLKEASLYTMAIGLPMGNAGLGLQVNYFGFSEFNESQVGLAYGKSLGNLVDIGAQFDYYNIHIAGYGNAGTLSFEAGAIFHPADGFHLGMHVYNPTENKIGKHTGERLASIYSFGLGYEASKELFVSADIIKEEDRPINVNAGLQYIFSKGFFARAGVLTVVSSPYAGIGLLWGVFRLDIAVSYHPQLGISPGMLLVYHFEKKT